MQNVTRNNLNEMFEVEFDDIVSTVMNFNKNLKIVLMTVHTMFRSHLFWKSISFNYK